jgi:hypothetical protein
LGYLTNSRMGLFDHSAPLSGRLVLVLTGTSIPEGLLARSLLESEGIPVVVKGESEGPYRLGPVYLYVPEEFEVQAGIILAEARSGGTDRPPVEPKPDQQIDR